MYRLLNEANRLGLKQVKSSQSAGADSVEFPGEVKVFFRPVA
jgi:hypothetical protein